MKVIIKGNGYVGKATAKFLTFHTDVQDIEFSDPPKGLEATSYFDAQYVVICVPTPANDSSYVNQAIAHAEANGFGGKFLIRSTVGLSVIDNLMERFSERIIVWPEFIRQNHWEEDCLDPKFVILGGAGAEEFSMTFGLMPRTNVQILTARDAMLYKLTANAFLATKVVMANAFYMLSDDWESLSRALMQDARLGETHWQVPGPDGQFGFGGACFPKDMETLITELGDRGVGSRLFQQILNLNEEVRHGKV